MIRRQLALGLAGACAAAGLLSGRSLLSGATAPVETGGGGPIVPAEPARVLGVPLPRIFSCFGSGLAAPDETRRYGAVIWHRTPENLRLLRAARAQHPDLVALMYRELYCVLRHETQLGESTGGWMWLDRHHSDWFQLDRGGRRVEIPDYPGRWMMDLREPGWREFWIEKTLRDVVEGGWDGVFVDDALTSLGAHQLPPLAGYAEDADLQAAVGEFLAAITAAFHRHGKLVIANVSNTDEYPGLWASWLAATDGLMEEHFAGDGWTWGRHAGERQLEALQEAARQGKWVLCLTYGDWTDQPRMETSLAAYLIGAGERTLWSYRPYANADQPAWHASWEPSLGAPLGEAERNGAVWRRRFEHGIAVVNAGTAPVTVEADGQPLRLQAREGRLIRHEEAR